MGREREGRGAREPGLTRRQLLAAGAATGAAVALPAWPASAAERSLQLDFSQLGEGEGWDPDWTTVGVANLRREGGEGVLQAGSDVFPSDPRPVAFAMDWRVRDATIKALIASPGLAPGVVLRRVAPGVYYAAVYDTDSNLLTIVRRSGARTPAEPVARLVEELRALASVPVPLAEPPFTLVLEAHGESPTRLRAEIEDARGRVYAAEAVDATPELQVRGDPGVLATSSTLLGTDQDTLSPLGSRRLLFGTQESAAVVGTPAGQAYLDLVERRSTARFRRIDITSPERPGPTAARRCRHRPQPRSRAHRRADGCSRRHRRLQRADREGGRPRTGETRLLACPPEAPRPRAKRPRAQLSRAPGGGRTRSGYARHRGLRHGVRPHLRPPRRTRAGRVRVAGGPQLPRHRRPPRPDDERVRRHLARLPAQSAPGAHPLPLLLRAPA